MGRRGGGLRAFLAAWIAVGFLVLVAGCASANKLGGSGMAAVLLQYSTPGQISEAVQEVFRENGYQVARAGLSQLVLEKEGSSINNLVYGNWTPGGGVWTRVKVRIIAAGEATWRVECDVFRVLDRNSLVEEEVKLSDWKGRGAQDLLDQVAKKLNGTRPAGQG